MAVETTTIQGKVLSPTGDGVAGGHIELRVSEPAKVMDGGTSHWLGRAVYKAVIGTDGTVGFALIPNDAMTPSSARWLAVYYPVDAESWEETWNLGTSPDPIDIGAITRE